MEYFTRENSWVISMDQIVQFEKQLLLIFKGGVYQ